MNLPTAPSYERLRDRIAVRLCNWFRFPAGDIAGLKGWAPLFQDYAIELIGMVRRGLEEDAATEATAAVVAAAREMVRHPASREVLERLEDAVDALDGTDG